MPALDGAREAQLIALACSPAPEGRSRWGLRLLASRMVEAQAEAQAQAEAEARAEAEAHEPVKMAAGAADDLTDA